MLKNRKLARDLPYQNIVLICLALACIAFKFAQEQK